jgi:hypothetical protein
MDVSVRDAGSEVFVAAAFLLYIEWCTQRPSCSGWGIPSWNLAHNGGSMLEADDLPREAPE